MWIALLFLFLVSSFDVDAASRPENAEDAPVRLPRRFLENSRTRRLRIENQTGFDGKVQTIHINSDEQHPRIQAYGLPGNSLQNDARLEKIRMEEKETDADPRNVRSIEVYGKSKDQLEMNGEIERLNPRVLTGRHGPRGAGARVSRSVDEERKPEVGEEDPSLDDLEAQDAKVFRPLFVYRQQIAKRQHRGRNQIHGYQPDSKIYYDREPIYHNRAPIYYERRPLY